MSANQDDTMHANGELDVEDDVEESTQENTPRRAPPPRPRPGDDTEQVSNSKAVPSNTVSPRPQESLRIPGHPTVISWVDQQRREHVLAHDVASALVHYDPYPQSTAFFRLRIKIGQTTRRTPKHVYLFIPPEHIQTLSLQKDPTPSRYGSKTKAALRRAGGPAGVLSLSFEMRKPCLLVAPKDLDASSPSNEDQSPHIVNMLDTVKLLSLQGTFVVHLTSAALVVSSLQSMCLAVSTPGLLASDPTLNDINGLYGGSGGMIVETNPGHPTPSVNVSEPREAVHDDALPPAYEPAAGSPPPAFTSSTKGEQPKHAGVKRRRAASSEGRGHAGPSTHTSTEAKSAPITLDMIMAGMIQGFGQINDRLTGLEQRLGSVESRLTQLESHCARQQLEETLDDVRHDLEKQIEELREEAGDLLESRVEEGIDDAKRELSEFVEGQVDDARGDILRRLAETPLQCSVNLDLS